jgi:uncharacterized protein (TIGR03083 family)
MTDEFDLGAAYREHREGLSAFVASLSEAQLATKLAACPDWTAWEVLAHVAGIPLDVLAGRLEGVGSDEWTQAQIDIHVGMSVADIVAEWATSGSQLEAMAGAAPDLAHALISDLVTHDLDARGGLGNTDFRSGTGVMIAYNNYANRLGQRLSDHGESLRIIADGEEQIVGAGPVEATVTGTRFELLRALTGRRSAEQIAEFSWEGNSQTPVGMFPHYPARNTALVE